MTFNHVTRLPYVLTRAADLRPGRTLQIVWRGWDAASLTQVLSRETGIDTGDGQGAVCSLGDQFSGVV